MDAATIVATTGVAVSLLGVGYTIFKNRSTDNEALHNRVLRLEQRDDCSDLRISVTARDAKIDLLYDVLMKNIALQARHPTMPIADRLIDLFIEDKLPTDEKDHLRQVFEEMLTSTDPVKRLRARIFLALFDERYDKHE